MDTSTEAAPQAQADQGALIHMTTTSPFGVPGSWELYRIDCRCGWSDVAIDRNHARARGDEHLRAMAQPRQTEAEEQMAVVADFGSGWAIISPTSDYEYAVQMVEHLTALGGTAAIASRQVTPWTFDDGRTVDFTPRRSS